MQERLIEFFYINDIKFIFYRNNKGVVNNVEKEL